MRKINPVLTFRFLRRRGVGNHCHGMLLTPSGARQPIMGNGIFSQKSRFSINLSITVIFSVLFAIFSIFRFLEHAQKYVC